MKDRQSIQGEWKYIPDGMGIMMLTKANLKVRLICNHNVMHGYNAFVIIDLIN